MADRPPSMERLSPLQREGGARLDDPFAPLLADLYEAALSSPGELPPELRLAAAQNHGLPPALAGLVDKIAHHAYRVNDDDVQALKQASYSEDQIYELVVSAAVGRACSMAERALVALQGSLAKDKP